MALPAWVRCHSCFSIRVSPAPIPSPIVVRDVASQTPETSLAGGGAGELTGGVGRVAQPPAATAKLHATKPANRIRIPPGENPSSLHDQGRTHGARRNATDTKRQSDRRLRDVNRWNSDR